MSVVRSGSLPPGAGARAGGGRSGRWVPAVAGGEWPGCPAGHGTGSVGSLDERPRRLSHEEFGVAQLLAADGHRVRSLAELPGVGRRPDLDVCGAGVEVKSFLPLADRGRPPSPQSVFNKLVDGAGQADAVILYGRGSGLTPGTVRRGLARLAAEGRAPSLSAVRVVGDGFDLAWVREARLSRSLQPALRSRPPGPELGI